jgi:uncharacterized membrane protein
MPNIILHPGGHSMTVRRFWSALAIKSGRIVGSSTITPTSTPRPVLWENGTMIDLAPDLPANEGGSANSINDAGQVVGTINYWVRNLHRQSWSGACRCPT